MPGELPPKRNGAIKIRAQVPREPRTTFYNTTSCLDRNPKFQLTVEDEDLADLTYSIWFIGSTSVEDTQVFQPTPIQGGSAVRTVSAPSSLGFQSALANRARDTTEILTVYVADTQFQEVVGGNIALFDRPEQTLPDMTRVRDIGSYDSFTWTLDVEACP